MAEHTAEQHGAPETAPTDVVGDTATPTDIVTEDDTTTEATPTPTPTSTDATSTTATTTTTTDASEALTTTPTEAPSQAETPEEPANPVSSEPVLEPAPAHMATATTSSEEAVAEPEEEAEGTTAGGATRGSEGSLPTVNEAEPRPDVDNDLSSQVLPPVQRWVQMDPNVGPATRGRHTVGVDAVRGILVMFGGQNYDLRCKYNDIATYDLSTDKWAYVTEDTSSEAASIPCPRSSHASVTTNDALYVFGGATGKSFLAAPGCCKDAFTWRYSFLDSSWERVKGDGLDALSARYGHTTVLAPDRIVYLFGGMTDMGCDNSTFRVNLKTLEIQKLVCTFVGTAGDVCKEGEGSLEPPPEEVVQGHRTAEQVRACAKGFGHTSVYNPYTHSMYVFGGTEDGRVYRSAFLRLDLTTNQWSVERAKNTPPQSRYVHCAAYDESRNAMYIFGGYCGAYRNDVHEYDFNTQLWREIRPNLPSSDSPCLRSGACCLAWEGHIYVFGGCDDQRYVNF